MPLAGCLALKVDKLGRGRLHLGLAVRVARRATERSGIRGEKLAIGPRRLPGAGRLTSPPRGEPAADGCRPEDAFIAIRRLRYTRRIHRFDSQGFRLTPIRKTQ